jgi:hypothetical protein
VTERWAASSLRVRTGSMASWFVVAVSVKPRCTRPPEAPPDGSMTGGVAPLTEE